VGRNFLEEEERKPRWVRESSEEPRRQVDEVGVCGSRLKHIEEKGGGR